MYASEDDAIRPIVAVNVCNKVTGKCRAVYALLDTGSNRDVIDEDLIDDLDIECTSELMQVKVLGNESLGPRRVASFSIQSLEGDFEGFAKNAMVANLLTNQSDIPPAKRDFSMHPHLASLPFVDVEEGIAMIIGISHCSAWTGGDSALGPKGSPMGLHTAFGWTVQGSGGDMEASTVCCNALSANDALLKESLDRIFFNDFAKVNEEGVGLSKDNVEAIRQLQESIRFDEKRGKYVVGLPWRYGRERAAQIFNSVNSREMAERRLKGMIPRFRRDPDRMKRVFAEVRKFEEKGVAVDIDDEDQRVDASLPVWHLPLLVVEENNKTRICHDAKASAGGIKIGRASCRERV